MTEKKGGVEMEKAFLFMRRGSLGREAASSKEGGKKYMADTNNS